MMAVEASRVGSLRMMRGHSVLPRILHHIHSSEILCAYQIISPNYTGLLFHAFLNSEKQLTKEQVINRIARRCYLLQPGPYKAALKSI